jgi:hypothetical protein
VRSGRARAGKGPIYNPLDHLYRLIIRNKSVFGRLTKACEHAYQLCSASYPEGALESQGGPCPLLHPQAERQYTTPQGRVTPGRLCPAAIERPLDCTHDGAAPDHDRRGAIFSYYARNHSSKSAQFAINSAKILTDTVRPLSLGNGPLHIYNPPLVLLPPSSRGLGHRLFMSATGVRIPLGVLIIFGGSGRRFA